MSTGFRIFLLMVFAFGAIWVYRYRSFEFADWLWPAPSTLANEAEASQTYPVEGVVENELDLVWIRLHGQRFRGPAGTEADLFRRWNPSPEEYAGELSPEDEQLVADLPVEEEQDPEFGEGAVEGPEDPGAEPVAPDDPEEGQVVETEEGTEAEAEPVEPPVAREEFIYVFKEGDRLWKIAEKYLGAGHRYREICDLNKDTLEGVQLDRIPVGTKLRIRREVREESLKNPPPQDDKTVEANSAPEPAEPRSRIASHTVKKNENLAQIAKRYYPGDPEGWKIIFEANKGTLASADVVRVGQVLDIPLPSSGSRSPPRGRRNSR